MDSCVSIEGVTLELFSNVGDKRVAENVQSALERGLPELGVLPETDIPICIVGGGPSLASDIEQIKARWKNGQHVWALNGTHDYLLAAGIIPHAAWCVDSQPENVRFYKKPNRLVRYHISSRCDPMVFDALKGFNVTVWHDASCSELVECIEGRIVVGGGTTIGMKGMVGAYACGYRDMHLFGYDSCYSGALTHHAYDQSWNDGEGVYQVACGDRVFTAAPWMLNQVKNFGLVAPQLAEKGCRIEVHGDGLLPATALDYARQIREQEQAA